MLDLILKHLLQSSTWRGIVNLIAASGLFAISDDLTIAIIAVGLAITGLINVIRNEEKGK